MRQVVTAARALIGVALLAWVLSRTGLRVLAPVLSNVRILFIMVGLTLFGAAVEAERLRVLFRAAGLRLTWSAAYRVVPVGFFFNFCIPGGTGGDVVKLYYLVQGNRGRAVEVAAVLLLDRIIALGAVLVFVLGMMLANQAVVSSNPVLQTLELFIAAALSAVLFVIALAWSVRLRGTSAYRWFLTRVPLKHYVSRLADAVHQFKDRKRAVSIAALISLTGHMGAAATFITAAKVILPEASWHIVALLSMTGMLANALPFTPGGMGVGEAAFEQLFRLVGYTGGAALILLWRVSVLPIATVGALLYATGLVHPRDTADMLAASPTDQSAPRTRLEEPMKVDV